eukprot:Nitzschia sp. Nitz4//scaffold32_size149145//6540//8115//NITZ4_002861-RA/size149145-augustus-gene-0.46-mRNA-1//-1//CDS//3329548015//8875//frame0
MSSGRSRSNQSGEMRNFRNFDDGVYGQHPRGTLILPGQNGQYRDEYGRSSRSNSKNTDHSWAKTQSMEEGSFTQSDQYCDESDDGIHRRGIVATCCLVLFIVASVFTVGMMSGFGIRKRQAKNSVETSTSSAVSSETMAPIVTSHNSSLLVGAYYYPWYGNNFHNGDGYLRNQLSPQHFPTLGEYDDSLSDTIRQHLEWSRQANIGLWITSWWGPNRQEDNTTRDVILPHSQLGDMKIAIHYESGGRIPGSDITNVLNDMAYIAQTYFSHPNYYRINGRPVVFLYLTRKLENNGVFESAILAMRSVANKYGENLYIIGDHAFEDAPAESEASSMLYLDAITNFDVYGSMGRPSPYAGVDIVREYYEDQADWKEVAAGKMCAYVPSVSPGYNDRGVRLDADHPPLSRRLSANHTEGSLFAVSIEYAMTLMDSSAGNLLVVNSFNEWHEDTQIEPATGENAMEPDDLTGGLEYTGYGELYLDILRELTTSNATSDNIFGANE